jgi:regulatory GntR family protein
VGSSSTSSRERSVPRYFEIEQDLRGRVARGQAGDRLPSDAELCAEFGVSRMTARHARCAAAVSKPVHVSSSVCLGSRARRKPGDSRRLLGIRWSPSRACVGDGRPCHRVAAPRRRAVDRRPGRPAGRGDRVTLCRRPLLARARVRRRAGVPRLEARAGRPYPLRREVPFLRPRERAPGEVLL